MATFGSASGYPEWGAASLILRKTRALESQWLDAFVEDFG
jgi:hypothetical protein